MPFKTAIIRSLPVPVLVKFQQSSLRSGHRQLAAAGLWRVCRPAAAASSRSSRRPPGRPARPTSYNADLKQQQRLAVLSRRAGSVAQTVYLPAQHRPRAPDPQQHQRRQGDVNGGAGILGLLGLEDAAAGLSSGLPALTTPQDAEILGLVGPAFFTTLMEPVQALVDTACVGSLGTEPLAAVGLGTLLFTFGISFFTALQVVTTSRVAAHAAKGQAHQASEATADALWLALLCGLGLSAGLLTLTPTFVQALGGQGDVLSMSVGYVSARAIACPGALLYLAATGAARGHKDAATPLLGAVAMYGTNLVLDLVLILGLRLGPEGAGVAAAAGQYAGLAVVLSRLTSSGKLALPDLARGPPGAEAASPYASAGAALSTCNLTGSAVAMAATAQATGLGPAALAAHTVLRQVLALCLGTFTSFNSAAQSLVASGLGSGDKQAARGVLLRTGQLAVVASIPAAAALSAGQGVLASLFSSDDVVRRYTAEVLPMLVACMPLDAAGAVMEGGLLASLETPWIAKRTAAGAAAALAALAATSQAGAGMVGVWAGIKVLNVATLALDWRRLTSDESPFRDDEPPLIRDDASPIRDDESPVRDGGDGGKGV